MQIVAVCTDAQDGNYVQCRKQLCWMVLSTMLGGQNNMSYQKIKSQTYKTRQLQGNYCCIRKTTMYIN